MTDFTLSSGNTIQPWRNGWPATIRHYQVSTGISSAIIYRGSLVTLDPGSTNQRFVKRSTATDAPNIVGYSCEQTPSTMVAGTTIAVWEANPYTEFVAVTQNGVIDSTSVGEKKAIVYDSTKNIHYVDLAESTATKLRVIITQLIDNPGDSGGRVAFRHITGPQGCGSTTTTQSTVAFLAFYA